MHEQLSETVQGGPFMGTTNHQLPPDNYPDSGQDQFYCAGLGEHAPDYDLRHRDDKSDDVGCEGVHMWLPNLMQGMMSVAFATITVADPRPPTADLTLEAPTWPGGSSQHESDLECRHSARLIGACRVKGLEWIGPTRERIVRNSETRWVRHISLEDACFLRHTFAPDLCHCFASWKLWGKKYVGDLYHILVFLEHVNDV
eukprot:493653-Pelagomonas_calceolata.AAC.3